MRQYLKTSLLIGHGCLAGLGSVAFADSAPAPAEHQPAVWEERQYSFAFLGFTTTYSCDGLADKLKLLLLASGARPDVKATSGACANGFGRPDKFARADLTFYVLVPGTSDSKAAPVDGVWRPVELATRKPRELGLGDCELVEQFKNMVLPLLSTRKVEERTTCIPNQYSGSSIDLKFETLTAGPAKGGNKVMPAPNRS